MADGGFFERKTISPTSLTIVILLHGAAITALAMSKMEVIDLTPRTPTKIYNVFEPPEPKPEPIPEPQPAPRTQVDYVPPIVPPLPRPSNDVVIRPTPDIPTFDPRPGTVDLPVDPPKPQPRPEPVRAEAQMLRSSELQPPYPASEERAEVEGSVSVRVTIGTNGRVIRVEKVSATNDAFYRATERHALRAWRFRPATVDGRPVESSKVITVRFMLND